jgi:acetylornithine deacetylase/succinyl-diaminopimelate desuccinylase-like protein
MPHPKVDEVRAHAEARFEATLERLNGYLKVPAISCDAAHFDDVRKLASKVRDDLEALGFDNARVLELDDALPCVSAEMLKAGDDKPTVLIYGHLDLQPVKGEPWTTPPHEPTKKGERLYARGSADDMGGWVSHLAAMESWLSVAGELPCNVKLLIEGEEEIGSPNLERFMDTYPEVFESDAMVLTDCENPSTEIPGLTVSLRGLLELDVTCDALHSDVHSGLWGNMAPDPATSLIKLLSRIIDDDGRLNVGRVEVPADWQKAAWDVPLDDDVIRAGAHLIDEVKPLPDHGRPPAEWLWRQPAVTVLSTTFPAPGSEKNAVRASAKAALSFRVAPGQAREELRAIVVDALTKDPPGGVKVTVEDRGAAADSWLYTPKGPAFDAADRAYDKTWGKKLLQVGVGGSIPFVALFGRRFGDLPLILNGVMDPETGAHGPDESMHLGVFKKAIAANVHLLDELAAVPELAPKR